MATTTTPHRRRHPLADPTAGNPPSCADGHNIQQIHHIVNGVSAGMRWRCPRCGLDLGPVHRPAGVTSGDQLHAAASVQDHLGIEIGEALAVVAVVLHAVGLLDGGAGS